MNWIMRKGSPLSFKQGLDQFKSETKEGKEISNSLFQISPHKSTRRGRKEFIFIAEAICAPDIGMERFTGKSRENVILTYLQLNLEGVRKSLLLWWGMRALGNVWQCVCL